MAKGKNKTEDRVEAAAATLETEREALHTLAAQGLEVMTPETDPLDDAADALLQGRDVATVASPSADNRADALRRALTVRKARVEAAERELTAAHVATRVPGIREAAQEIADAAGALGDAVNRYQERVSALDTLVGPGERTRHCPGLRVLDLRTDERDSRLNRLLDALEEGYQVETDRSARDDAMAAAADARIEEERRKRDAGGVVSAGPEGITTYHGGGNATLTKAKPAQQRRRPW